jgi:hypothetical protein
VKLTAGTELGPYKVDRLLGAGGMGEIYHAQDVRRSNEGGVQRLWRADGREIYYLGLDAALYAVEVRVEGQEFRTGGPQLLFRTPLPVISAVVEQYRVSSNGGRFLLCAPLTSPQRQPLRMLVNWSAKLARAR